MGNSTHQEQHHYHMNDGLRKTIIVILVFGIIAPISYSERLGRLHKNFL